jgi:hypothetical protein
MGPVCSQHFFVLSISFSTCGCVTTVVVAEGAFFGSGDSKMPLVAASFARLINLILDSILMFPLKMGMMGAAATTALSQYAATGVYGWRMVGCGMLPQTFKDTVATTISAPHVVKAILGANLSMLANQGSLLVFYTYATAFGDTVETGTRRHTSSCIEFFLAGHLRDQCKVHQWTSLDESIHVILIVVTGPHQGTVADLVHDPVCRCPRTCCFCPRG